MIVYKEAKIIPLWSLSLNFSVCCFSLSMSVFFYSCMSVVFFSSLFFDSFLLSSSLLSFFFLFDFFLLSFFFFSFSLFLFFYFSFFLFFLFFFFSIFLFFCFVFSLISSCSTPLNGAWPWRMSDLVCPTASMKTLWWYFAWNKFFSSLQLYWRDYHPKTKDDEIKYYL